MISVECNLNSALSFSRTCYANVFNKQAVEIVGEVWRVKNPTQWEDQTEVKHTRLVELNWMDTF